MANVKTKPLIPVVKADGSVEWLTLDEIRAKKQHLEGANLGSLVKEELAQPVADKIKKPEMDKKPNPAPAAKAKRSVIPAKAGIHNVVATIDSHGVYPDDYRGGNDNINPTKDDFVPSGDEPSASSSSPKVPPARADQVEAVLKKLSFKVSIGNTNRLRTILQLRLKDVRSAEQTKEALMRRELEGGLGLSAANAAEALELCQKASARERGLPEVKVAPLKFKVGADENLPMSFEQPKPPTVSTPNNNFVHSSAVHPQSFDKLFPAEKSEEDIKSLISRPTAKTEAPAENFRLRPMANKPNMRDVTAKPIEMSAVDEIRYFNLVDFRRLSGNPAEAAQRLAQKFRNLKEESILLLWDGLAAWQNSPLYWDYVGAGLSALAKRQPLSAASADKNKIQLEEIKAVAEMNRELGG